MICPICRETFRARVTSYHGKTKKYCSHQCAKEYRQMIAPILKLYKKPNCEKCGGWLQLEVHHKSQDIRDNRPENLETLCRTCHTVHHRGKNMWKIWERQAQGKVRAEKRRARFGVPLKVYLKRQNAPGILDIIERQKGPPKMDNADLILLPPSD